MECGLIAACFPPLFFRIEDKDSRLVRAIMSDSRFSFNNNGT